MRLLKNCFVYVLFFALVLPGNLPGNKSFSPHLLAPKSDLPLPENMLLETLRALRALKPGDSVDPVLRPLIQHFLGETGFTLVAANEDPFLILEKGVLVRVRNKEGKEGLIFIDLQDSLFEAAQNVLAQKPFWWDKGTYGLRVAEACRYVEQRLTAGARSSRHPSFLGALLLATGCALLGCPSGGNQGQQNGPQVAPSPATPPTARTSPEEEPTPQTGPTAQPDSGGTGPNPNDLAAMGLEAKRGLDRWLQRVSQTRTGLPVSHFADRATAQGAFTYDLAHVALRFARDGQHERARQILDFFISRYQRFTLRELEGLKDRNNVYGILRILPDSNSQPQVYIINCIDTSNTSEPGAGAVEWYTDGGPQFWLGLATVNELRRNSNLNRENRERYEAFLRSLIEIGRSLMNEESVVAAGPRRQDIGGAPDRNQLGHVENMWDLVGLLESSATYFEATQPSLAQSYRASAHQILTRLREKGIYSQERDNGWFWQGFAGGAINHQIPTDVQSWGILAVGPERIDEIWGRGTAERIYQNMIRTMLVVNEYVRPDNRRVVTIGADYGDPHRPDFVSARGGAMGVISDEWTGGVILAMDTMAQFFHSRGEIEKAEEVLAMADALRHFMLLRAHRTEDGGWSLPYATHQNVPTGFGWNTPRSDESLAGLWAVFPLAGSNFEGGANPFTLDGEINLAGIRRLGVRRGVELLRRALRANNIFTPRNITGPGDSIEEVAPSGSQPPSPAVSRETGFHFLGHNSNVAIHYFSSRGDGVGEIPAEGENTIGVESISGWNSVELKLPQILDISHEGYRFLRFRIKASPGAQRIKINFVDQGYIDRAQWHIPPPCVTEDIVADGNWHEVTIDLNEAAQRSGADLSRLRALSFDPGSVNRSGFQFYIQDPQLLREEPSGERRAPSSDDLHHGLHFIDPKTWDALGRAHPAGFAL